MPRMQPLTDEQINAAAVAGASESTGDFSAGAHWAIGMLTAPPAPAAVTEGASDPLPRDTAELVDAIGYWERAREGESVLDYAKRVAAVAVPGSLTDEQIIDLADDFKSQYTHGGTTFDEFDYVGYGKAIRDRALATTRTAAQPESGVKP